MRTACHPIRTAVTSSNQWGSISDVSHAPARRSDGPGSRRTARLASSPRERARKV